MSLVVLDQAAARHLTERIRQAAGELWSLLAQAHDQRAWEALGYSGFKSYVQTEFGMSRKHAYRLLDQAKVIEAITDAACVSERTHIPVSIEEARDLRPHLELVAANVRDATEYTEPELIIEAARAAVEETRKQIREFSKPDLGGGLSHPARYGFDLLDVFAKHLTPGMRVLDPFAGTGRIHMLRELANVYTTGIELEPEWANLHPDTQVGNALDLPFEDHSFDAVVTSPTYGNRFADHHNAYDPERRHTYKHDLGRDLDPDNSGQLHWGPEYQAFHTKAWKEAIRVLRPDGRFILNIKDHIRGGQRQPVTGWHTGTLARLGLMPLWHEQVDQRGHRATANGDARVDYESIIIFEKDLT